MAHCNRLFLVAGFLAAVLLTAAPAGAQNVGDAQGASQLGGPYYRGANNPSGYYRGFRPRGPYAGGLGVGGFGGFRGSRGMGRLGGFDAFGDAVAGPFGDYRGYGNYYTRDWWNPRLRR